jgi:hypothetical protein
VKLILALLVAAAAFGQKLPDPPDEKKVIAETTAKALAYSKELPDFVCRQISRRNEDPKGLSQWKLLETISEEVSLIGGKEEYRMVAINGKKTEQARPSGVFNISQFGDFLNWIFDPKAQAEISWSQWDSLRGHRVHVLGYRVKKENSQFVVSKGKGQQAPTGFFGVINVDAESGAILKLGVVATDIPSNFPVQGVAIELHYEFAKIGDHYYVVPLKADLHSKEGKTLLWTEVEYRDYRKP